MMQMPQMPTSMPMQMPTGQATGTVPTTQMPAVVLPTRYVVRDFYFPQPVQYIQPVEVVNRYHPVPCPQYSVTCTERDIICEPDATRD